MAADYPHGVFVYTKGKETVFTNCPPALRTSASCSRFLGSDHSGGRGNQNKAKQKKKNPLDGKIKMLCITCSAARQLCFPFRLHKRVSFHAGVLMQLALLLPNVCQIVLWFQRSKGTLSSFSFGGPGSNLEAFSTKKKLLSFSILSFFFFFPESEHG